MREKSKFPLNHKLADEAKAIVVLAFRDGPIEDIHAGKPCPTCSGNASYSRISDPEMKQIMKNAADRVYSMLWLKENEPTAYAACLEFGRLNSRSWDDPIFKLP